jgi:hypothetical protein
MGDSKSKEPDVDEAEQRDRLKLRDETLAQELERRLKVFDETDDDAFGRFTSVDWTICTVFFFVLPILIAWWAQ